jgi:hypothetical protein
MSYESSTVSQIDRHVYRPQKIWTRICRRTHHTFMCKICKAGEGCMVHARTAVRYVGGAWFTVWAWAVKLDLFLFPRHYSSPLLSLHEVFCDIHAATSLLYSVSASANFFPFFFVLDPSPHFCSFLKRMNFWLSPSLVFLLFLKLTFRNLVKIAIHFVKFSK